MRPLPSPHRVCFLPSAIVLPARLEALALLPAKLLAAVVFDHLVRHPVVSVSDFDDEPLTDERDQLVDARHPAAEELIDERFRVARRHEVLWLELSLDPQRPQPVKLRARRPAGPIDDWTAPAHAPLSAQLAHVIDQWLDARRLPRAGAALPPFGAQDLIDVTVQLDRALVAMKPPTSPDDPPPTLPEDVLTPPARLGVAFVRALANLCAVDAAWDARILAIDPGHVAARRGAYLASLRDGGDRRAILPLLAEAPMYGKAYLSVWGEAFAGDRPDEGMGLRHQGVAAMLLPHDPIACHNYSLQLHEAHRREEAYRWSDRATIASPEFNPAHLDCVRRLRAVQRPGQAFAEAQYRCKDVLERWRDGKIDRAEWAARYHAGLLLALVHLDVGRLDEAIALAEDTLRELPAPGTGDESFVWARDRIRAWRGDPNVLARAWAREGSHRCDPGRVLDGLARAGVDDPDDAAMQLEALVATGREDLALVGFHHLQGTGSIGDGRARLTGVKVGLVAGGDLHDVLDNLQIVQLRRPQSRLEAEIDRLLRLAVCRPPEEWEAVIARRLDHGAVTLARRAARDLADFVPGLATPTIARALGERTPWRVEPAWLIAFQQALPRMGAAGAAIDERLAPPQEQTLAAADLLAQEWWTVLPPPNKERERHAEAAIYALGVAVARYLAATSSAPSPIAGAYRHVATEAVHLVRRARYHIEDTAARGLLELLERCAEKLARPDGRDDWMLDLWLARIEHALDLDGEAGAYLPDRVAGLPKVAGLLRGDERLGWELRTAYDFASEPGMGDAARHLFERCARLMETGAAEAAWSSVAAQTLPVEQAIDIHWTAALANPAAPLPWLHLAHALLRSPGRREPGLDAAIRGVSLVTDAAQRTAAIAALDAPWRAAGLDVPFSAAEAQARGVAALHAGDAAMAVRCLRWAHAQEPRDADRARLVAQAYATAGDAHRCVRAFAAIDRDHAGKLAGTALLHANHHAPAVLALRHAMPRLATPDDWRLLAVAAWYAEDDAMAAIGYERYLAAGGAADAQTLHGLATALYASGQWAKCEEIAKRLLDVAGGDPTFRACGLHAMARALAGKGEWGDALRCASEAAALEPMADQAAERAETVRLCKERQTPPFHASAETSVERRAWDALAAGDVATPERLAASGNSWGLFRAALAAAEHRGDREVGPTVNPKALEASLMVLDRTNGTTLPDATLCRIRALRLRETGFIQLDPPPPLGARMSRDAFEAEYARRRGAVANEARRTA
jgi:tetratricopeptide (TPR) repeat protein